MEGGDGRVAGIPATRPTVAGGTGRPSRGGRISPTLRVDRPSAKPARMTRSISRAQLP